MAPRIGTIATVVALLVALWWASGLPWGLFALAVGVGIMLNAAEAWYVHGRSR